MLLTPGGWFDISFVGGKAQDLRIRGWYNIALPLDKLGYFLWAQVQS